MNNKFIKTIVSLISIIFLILLLNNINLNNKADYLVNFQVEVAHNRYLNKDTTLKVNNIFSSIYVNYDHLLLSNKILKNDVDKLEKKHQKNNEIKKLKKIIWERDHHIDLIKRTNSIISNSLKYINHLHFTHSNELGELTERLIDLSYEIKATNDRTIMLYEKSVEKLSKITLKNKQHLKHKDMFLVHTKIILENAKIMKKNVDKFKSSDLKLNTIYDEINNNILDEYLWVKTKNSYSQTILFVFLIIFVYLIQKFFIVEKIHKESEKKLQDIIDKNVITSAINIDGITQSVSAAHCKISGYKEEELVNKPNYMMTQSSRSKEIMDTLNSGNIWSGEICDTTKNGEKYWVSSVIEPVYDSNNNIKSFLGIRHDITNTISLEELTKNQEEIIASQTEIANEQRDKAIKASKSKSEFLANMSHEIRTPLNTISGFIDLLKDNEDDKTKLDYLDVVNSSSKNLLSIINDILDFSKIESGKLQIDKIDFNPANEFSLIIRSFEKKFMMKKIDFITSLDNLPVVLSGDLLRIQQVINNLLSNACKFTSEDKKVHLKILYKNSKLHVFVEDEGIGISKKYQNRIFDSFSQEDSSTTRKYGGTGLGLSISYNLIELMNGKLEVTSTLEKGSTFSFSIPLEKKEKSLDKGKKNIPNNFKGHILLAEDNKANQVFMKVILKKINLTFDIANDGQEAVEKFSKNDYDLILMDENMPNMCGIEATEKILQIEKKIDKKHTPIIALTANALAGDREKFLNAGMDEYLSKPLNKNALYRVLNKFLIIQEN